MCSIMAKAATPCRPPMFYETSRRDARSLLDRIEPAMRRQPVVDVPSARLTPVATVPPVALLAQPYFGFDVLSLGFAFAVLFADLGLTSWAQGLASVGGMIGACGRNIV
jgi:hypothetical protein